MTFNLPVAQLFMQIDWDVDPHARGAFAGTGEAQFATRNTKVNGSLPLTGANATAFVNTQASSSTGPLRGVYWRLLATGLGIDVSTDTELLIVVVQYNAPNRVQITTKANDGYVFRFGTGSGSPPTNYRTWQVAGNDTVAGSAREAPFAFIMDMNASDHDALIGTYDNTDVTSFGVGTVRFNISGTSTNQIFLQRCYKLQTTRGASGIPDFTGAGSDWDDIVTAVGTAYNTKITHDWLGREGAVFTVACPISFGDGSTATTFNDNGVAVFWPNSGVAADPRVHVTDQAFRVYTNLRNNAADTVTLSGFYDAGDSYPLWDFDQGVSAATVTVDGARFNRTGDFEIGEYVTGAATFNDCGTIQIQHADADLDGSVFRNPHSDHLLSLVP